MVHSRTTYEENNQPGHRILKQLLRIPVFYKELIANSLIIFFGPPGGTWLAVNLNSSPYATPTSLAMFVFSGWFVSIALNFIVLQFAFRPLKHLGQVMNRVQAGERTVRAPLTGADPQADQLARTLNMM